MLLSDSEKQKIIEFLDDMDDITRKLVLATLDAFTEWLIKVAYSIFLKIKDALGQLWQWLSSKF